MEDLRTLKKYHSALLPYVWPFAFSILFDAIMTICGLSIPLFMRLFFDYAYPYKSLTLLNTAIAATVAAYFIYFFLSVISDYLQIYVHQEATAKLTERVFNAICRLPLAFHKEKRSGDLLQRITDDVGKAVGMVANILPTLVIDGGKFIIILAIALYIDPKLTLLALLAVPLYAFEAKFYASRLAKVGGESTGANSAIYTRVQERLANIKTVKAYAQEQNETLTFSHLLRRRYRIGIKERLLDVVRIFTNSITIQIWSVFLIWFLGYQVVAGKITVGEVVALLLFFEQLGDPIRSFIDLFSGWKKNMASMERLDEILDAKPEDDGEGGRAVLSIEDGRVEAAGIDFSHGKDRELFRGLSVSFPPHSVTAIVGSSDSGKTTLVDLVMRFFDPAKGAILVDGQDISEIKLCSLRGNLAMIAQDAALFDGSIIDNILYGSEQKERGDAMRAAKLAGASDFIERLPGMYDAQVGIGGSLLSGGERQRIAIARALLKDPAVIIFVEAASGLDAESELRIHDVISKLRRTKTVIVIAHRLSTIKTADNIIVLEDGKIVEEGKFDPLMERKNALYRFYWRQFGGLAAFRQHLQMELERAARYGSKFCAAVLKLGNYADIEDSSGAEAAEEYAERVDYALKKKIRIGDNAARLERDTILILLPEIDEEHMGQFFMRMQGLLSKEAGTDRLYFVGARIAERKFKTAEELLSALKGVADSKHPSDGHIVMSEDELFMRSGR